MGCVDNYDDDDTDKIITFKLHFINKYITISNEIYDSNVEFFLEKILHAIDLMSFILFACFIPLSFNSLNWVKNIHFVVCE